MADVESLDEVPATVPTQPVKVPVRSNSKRKKFPKVPLTYTEKNYDTPEVAKVLSCNQRKHGLCSKKPNTTLKRTI
jgi:hypothetical protein